MYDFYQIFGGGGNVISVTAADKTRASADSGRLDFRRRLNNTSGAGDAHREHPPAHTRVYLYTYRVISDVQDESRGSDRATWGGTSGAAYNTIYATPN